MRDSLAAIGIILGRDDFRFSIATPRTFRFCRNCVRGAGLIVERATRGRCEQCRLTVAKGGIIVRRMAIGVSVDKATIDLSAWRQMSPSGPLFCVRRSKVACFDHVSCKGKPVMKAGACQRRGCRVYSRGMAKNAPAASGRPVLLSAALLAEFTSKGGDAKPSLFMGRERPRIRYFLDPTGMTAAPSAALRLALISAAPLRRRV